ncbi:MAG: DMT family protein [Novosphingobium sp.]
MGWNAIAPVGLLAGSNLLMNLAWYGHLKAPQKALWIAVLASWGIAFFEYCLAVPANRIGVRAYSLAELKTLQELFSLLGFIVVAWTLVWAEAGNQPDRRLRLDCGRSLFRL